MSTTITIRTDDALRRALEQRAREQGKPLSAVVREILARALEESPMSGRTGHLRGGLALHGDASEAWRRTLRERNWRL